MNMPNVFSIVRIGGPGTGPQVCAQVEESQVNLDTHKAYDVANGTYTVPVDGFYQVQTITSNGQMESKIQQFKAGDVHATFKVPLKPGDWIILAKENTLLEIIDIQPSTSHHSSIGVVIDSTESDRTIGQKLYFITGSHHKRVPPNTNLRTHNLLYDRS